MHKTESEDEEKPGRAEEPAPAVNCLRTSEGYQFYIETPMKWDLPGPSTRVTGWCLAPKGEEITGVRLLSAHGEAFGHYGGPRPDVAAAFMLPPEFAPCGFDVSVVLPGGATRLSLQVCDEKGDWHELGRFTAKVPWYLLLPFWPRQRLKGRSSR
jgi:hypothetical protein